MGDDGGVVAVACLFGVAGVADTDAEVPVIGVPEMPIKPRTSDKMLATALSSLPGKLLAGGARPEGFRDDRRLDGSKVKVFGGW